MLIIYHKKIIIESDWLRATQFLVQTVQKQVFSGFSTVADINRFHYPVILTGKCFHVYIFLRGTHVTCLLQFGIHYSCVFSKSSNCNFDTFWKKNLAQMKNSKLISKSFDTLTYTIWLFHLNMKSCFTLRILFISTAAIYLMLVRISSIQVSLQLNSLNSGRQCL